MPDDQLVDRPEDLPLLRKLAKDGDRDVRATAMQALASLTETLASLSRPEYLPLLRERAKDQDSDVLESACIPTGLWIKLSVSLSDLLSASWPLSESGWCRRSIGEASERESGRQRRPLKRPQCSRSYLGSIEINKKAIVSGFGSLA